MNRAATLVALMIVTVLVYWPSLRGGYVLDDYANIADNAAVHMTSLSWDALRNAFWSSPSDQLVRPLAMLTFALNWYAAGGAPFWMKLTNLFIHLANGLLVFVLIGRLARAANRRSDTFGDGSASADRLALFVAAAWMLAPINFTAVGYVVQRMESLGQLFVLGGLIAYIGARTADASSARTAKCAAALILFTVVASVLGVAAAWVAGKLVPDFFGPRLGAWAKLLLQSVVGIVVSFGVLMALKVEELQPATSRFTRLIKRG